MKIDSELITEITEDFSTGDGHLLRKLISFLKTCENPVFTLHAAIYWICNDNHTGQRSKGYGLLSSSPYKPSPNESTDSLKEIDFEFSYVYDFLESLKIDHKLYL